jgi:hypothetical protein
LIISCSRFCWQGALYQSTNESKIKLNQQGFEYVHDLVKPAQWKKERQMTWLKKNPIPSIATDDLAFIKSSLEQLTKFAQHLVDNHKTHGLANAALRKNLPGFGGS